MIGIGCTGGACVPVSGSLIEWMTAFHEHGTKERGPRHQSQPLSLRTSHHTPITISTPGVATTSPNAFPDPTGVPSRSGTMLALIQQHCPQPLLSTSATTHLRLLRRRPPLQYSVLSCSSHLGAHSFVVL